MGGFVSSEAGCGPLCVFDSLESAKNFLLHEVFCGSNIRDVVIFSCEIVRSTKDRPFTEDSFLTFIPNGTILADLVKLNEPALDIHKSYNEVYCKW